MILVFIFLGIIILIMLLFLVLILSNIRIKVENLRIKNLKNDKKYKIFLQIFLFDKIKIFSIKIDDKKVKKISNSNRFKNIDLKRIKGKISTRYVINSLKNLKIQFKKLNLKIKVGVEDAPLTSYSVAIISGIISILLPHFVKNNNNINNEIKYKIIPKYNTNALDICLDSIISIKIVHIILTISNLIKQSKKERNVIKNGRTSNRRTYAYSHEFN